ncbi:hypothetical protein GGX14DRAFT_139411 [Mycena pura]|uniref:F-box domain-containing protein n=1 Tax=Mycena pura TaxID=153505 RepID=A0AAD6VB72_9AGAR|nr:hypothetical protein GGX14DRAFT_139411 [Mycena pura]
MFADLCMELLQEIGSQLAFRDLKSLRVVRRDIGIAMGYLFYSSVILRSGNLTSENRCTAGDIWFLKRLASGETGWSLYATALRIESRMRTTKLQFTSDAVTEDLFVSALESMTNIRTVFWRVRVYDPPWMIDAVRHYLHSLPRLDDLSVVLDTGVQLPLNWTLSIQSLKVEAPCCRQCRIVNQVSRIATGSHGLTTLHVTGFNDWSALWSTLRADNNLSIRLREIKTNIITSDLLSYLCSYSGIEILCLTENLTVALHPKVEGSRAKSDRLADIFFHSVLPLHTDSLVELAWLGAFEGSWSFGTHNVHAISTLLRLRSLTVSVNAWDVGDVEPHRNVVTLLFRMACDMPCLGELTVCSLAPDICRGTVCLRRIRSHKNKVRRLVVLAMEIFGHEILRRTSRPTWRLWIEPSEVVPEYNLYQVKLSRARQGPHEILRVYCQVPQLF